MKMKLNNFFQKHELILTYALPVVAVLSVAISRCDTKGANLSNSFDLNNNGIQDTVKLISLYGNAYEPKAGLVVNKDTIQTYNFEPHLSINDLDNDNDLDFYIIKATNEFGNKFDTVVKINDGNNKFSKDILYRTFTGD